jgi:putative hydrolase of the HAD superfamily
MTLPDEIQAVTLDVGGTLIKPWPSVGHVYAEVAAQHGKKIPAAVLDQRFTKAWRAQKNFNHGREEWAALVAQTFAGLWDFPTDGPFFSEVYDRFSEPDAWHIFEDVLPALDSLAARGINLGIISNWDERLAPLLARLGLAKYFEAVIVSCDIGFPKPSPVIFEHAAKKLGLPPGQILHVGDSAEHDVAGAKRAGYQALLLDRNAPESSGEVIRSLAVF